MAFGWRDVGPSVAVTYQHARARGASWRWTGALWLFAAALTGFACGFPNPRDCADGTCTDPSRPFCDQDGAIAGFDLTCIAVSCTPKQVAACRGDQAVTCNDTGTNYDLISCPLGCDLAAGGCRACASDSQCGNPQPVCDAVTGSCRVCRSDDECASKVCDSAAGTCVPESFIVYASPTGFGRWLLSQPCQLDQAVDVAVHSGPVTLRMLPGLYQQSLDVRVATVQPLKVVATGATIAPGVSPAIVIRDGANVAVRGVSTMAGSHLACGAANSTPSALSLQDASLVTLGDSSATISIARCSVIIASTDLSLNASEIAINTDNDAMLQADRFHIHGDNTSHIMTHASNVTMRMTNSLFEDVLLDLNTSDVVGPGSSFSFAFDTFILRYTSLDFGIGASAYQTVYFENDIIAALGSFDAVNGSHCQFGNSLLSNQSSPLPGTFVRDPQFVDVVMRNFHLLPSSSAVDAAIPPSQGLSSTHDFDGVPRPQGVKPDIGAYELAPR